MAKPEAVLSPADHDHFLQHGYVVVKGAVPAQVASRAAASLEEDAPGFDPAACVTDTMQQALAELFGPEIPFAAKYSGQDLARPRQDGVEWAMPPAHVDDAYPTPMPNDWAVGTFIFLTPVRSRGGAFVYFAGSPLRYRRGMAQSCHAIKEMAGAPEYSGTGAEFLAEPGDVLFFQHLMGHTGSDNVDDARTRHALLNRWVPQRRIVPGLKPFARMSTIEKANSARYLEHRFALELGVRRTPDGPEGAAALDAGWDWGGGTGRVRSYALLHFGGRARVLAVSEDDPARVRHWQSEDLVHWHATEAPDLGGGAVRALSLHQYGFAAILAVTGEDGAARLYSSLDFARWRPVARTEGCGSVTPWYVYANYPSKVAEEQALFVVPADDPTRVCCRWGPDWPAAAGGDRHSVAARAPGPVEDVVVAAYRSDRQCAFVADAADVPGGPTRLHYGLPQDIAVAEGALQPLASAGVGSPRRLRVYGRGSSYWLVTFLDGPEDRLFWGRIDWEETRPALRPLKDAADLDAAKSIVGMI